MFRTTKKIWMLCCFMGASVFGVQQAQAQAMTADVYMYSIGGWDLVEVTDSADEVIGFWGIPRVPVEIGNIRRLWFESIPGDDWEVWAFEPVAVLEKVLDLQADGASLNSIDFLLHQESIAADNAVNQDIDGGVSGLVTKGFLQGDPLTEPTGALVDPNPIIDLLADVGYPIAPGMTDLLVSGTAGSNVSMNQATKQSLNCLRSSHTSCGDCVCVKVEGPMVPEPWQIVTAYGTSGEIFCSYSRIEHHSYWKFGQDPDDNCSDCTEGSADNPIPYDTLVEIGVTFLDIENCPDTPPHY